MEEIRLTSWYGKSTIIYRVLSHLRWCRPSSINSMITGTRICHLLSPEFHDCQARVAFTKILVKSLERKPHETTSPWKWKVKYTLSLSIYMYHIYIYVLCCCAVSCYLTLYHVNCCYFFVSIQHHADHFSKKKTNDPTKLPDPPTPSPGAVEIDEPESSKRCFGRFGDV